MTQARAHRKTTPRAILSRLLVVLALVLFGGPQSHADDVANAGAAAQSKVDQGQGIVSVQRHQPRAQLPDDSSPELTVPLAALQALQRPFATRIPPTPDLSLLPVAIRILPPVRGPPAA